MAKRYVRVLRDHKTETGLHYCTIESRRSRRKRELAINWYQVVQTIFCVWEIAMLTGFVFWAIHMTQVLG